MRNPPNYGSIVNLGKGRRRPIAVRVPNGYKLRDDFTEIIQYKYIGYFENTPQGQKDARLLLAQYNAGINVPIQVNNVPTFRECAEAFVKRHVEVLAHNKGSISYNTERSLYGFIDNQCKDICDCKINMLKQGDIQYVADSNKTMAATSIGRLKFLIKGTFDYARKQGYITENFIDDIDFLYTKNNKSIHKVFTEEEVNKIWEYSDNEIAQTILMLIYSGLRINEFLSLQKNQIHLEEQYMICGSKTAAGKDRTVPIANKVLKFYKNRFNSDSDYLIPGMYAKHMSRNAYVTNWNKFLNSIGLEPHIPHDTRYTCASMLDKANVKDNIIKFILGHQQTDITNQVYVHPDVETLLENINKI